MFELSIACDVAVGMNSPEQQQRGLANSRRTAVADVLLLLQRKCSEAPVLLKNSVTLCISAD